MKLKSNDNIKKGKNRVKLICPDKIILVIKQRQNRYQRKKSELGGDTGYER